MVTGSHNPVDFNGFKVAVGKSVLHGKQIQEIKKIIENGEFLKGEGTIETKEIIDDYMVA